jgi:hypothetical protein
MAVLYKVNFFVVIVIRFREIAVRRHQEIRKLSLDVL